MGKRKDDSDQPSADSRSLCEHESSAPAQSLGDHEEGRALTPLHFCDFSADSNVWVFCGSTHYVCVGTHDDDSSFHTRTAAGMLKHLLGHLESFDMVPERVIKRLTALAKKE